MSDVLPPSSGAAADDAFDPGADYFHPPTIPTLVWCLHCGEEYDSWRMEYRIFTDEDGARRGFWCCPTPNCDGRGFGFDVFPVDENYVDPDGREMSAWDDDEPPTPEDDPDRPPDVPTPVRCEQCGSEYLSDALIWRVDKNADGGYAMSGWCCPVPGCRGMGFGMDIRPTDPNYRDPLGRRIWSPGEKPPPPHDEDIPY